MRRWKFLLPLLASSLCFAAQPDRITGAIDSNQAFALAKSHPPRAVPQNDQGPVDPGMKLSYITMLMAPSPSQQQALNLLLTQQQDKKSANYHKWLTPQQFGDQFGLSQNDLDKVTTWLKSQGFQILKTSQSRNSISFSGTAAEVESSFRTEIHNYKVNGELHFANATPLMLPSALNGVVRTVMGVHSFLPKPASRIREMRGASKSHPSYYDSSFLFPNILAPDDIATIYDISPLYTAAAPINGSGQTLGIIGQTDVYLADLNDFRSGFNLNPITGCTTGTTGLITACNSTYFQYVLVGSDPGAPSTCGDLSESDLDLEWSGAVARNAQIIFFNAPVTFNSDCTEILSGGGVNAALNEAIAPSSGTVLAHVLSMSYGACEDEASDLETLLQQANTEGITVVNSSDDQASAGCDFGPPNNEVNPPFSPAQFGLAVSYPASSPEVTGVGGTSISLANDSYPTLSPYWSTTLGPNGGTAVSYIPEQPWNDDEAFADYCHAPASGDVFCSQGGDPATPGWVPLTTTATEAQVQSDIWTSGGGGGASNCFYVNSSNVCLGAGPGPTGGGLAQPSYQVSLIVPGAPAGVRYVPDVSMLASPNFPGYIFCTPESQLENTSSTTSTCASGIASAVTSGSIIGGTSAAAPVFAGIVTLLNQAMNSNQGNLNPTLYNLAASPNQVFHPTTTGDNNVACAGGTPTGFPINVQCPGAVGTTGVIGYSASNSDPNTGYNLVNGLGSVDVNNLVNALVVPDFNLNASSSTVSPNPVPAGQSGTVTLTISPLNSGSNGMVVNFSNTTSCTGLPTGASCNFNPPSVNFDGTDPVTTQLTILTTANMTVPATAQTITITPVNSPKTTATVSLTVIATNQTYSLAISGGTSTFAVNPGATVQVPIVVSGTNGFITSGNTTALPITYTCLQSSIPAQATCSFSPTSGSSVSATSVALSVLTTAPTSQLRTPFSHGSRIFYALLLPGLFGVVLSGKARRRGARLLSLLVILSLSTLWLGACGGSSNSSQKNAGTPAGSYSLIVNATTGGATPLTSTLTINITVN